MVTVAISVVGVTFLNGVISRRLNVSDPREALLPWGSSVIVKMWMDLQEDVHTLLYVCLEVSDRKNGGKTGIKKGY